ncbi:MAG: hypothetical protein Q9227_009200, partial [Pyrenula ochraceoflavens]
GEAEDIKGTYSNSFSWFEARIKPRLTPDSETESRFIQCNVHASLKWRKHIKIWDARSQEPGTDEWLAMLKPGDQILLYAMA